MIAGWFIVVDFIVVFSLFKDDTLVDNPATQCPFFQLDSLVQQICSSGPTLGKAVQTASVSVTISLSILVPFGGKLYVNSTLEWIWTGWG